MTKLLIVDDEELICKGIESMIHRLDSLDIDGICTGGDGEEGLALFQLYQPDIVITDIRMPVMNGLEMMKQIRLINREVSIVVLSGYADFNYVKQAFLLGAVNYLLKPVTIEELERVIGRILLEQRQIAASDADQIKEKERFRKVVLDNFLHKVFSWQQLTVSSILDQMEGIELLLPHQHFCLVQFKSTDKIGLQPLVPLIQSISERLSVKFDNRQILTHRFMPGNDQVIYLLNFSGEIEYADLVIFYQQVIVKVKETFDQRFFTAISSCQTGIESLGVLYRQVESAMAHKILYPENDLITYASIEPRTDRSLIEPGQILALKAALRAMNLTHFNSLIDEMFTDNRLSILLVSSVHDLYLSVVLAISEVFHENSGMISDSLQKDFFAFETLSELRIFIKDEAGRLFLGKHSENQTGLIHLIKKYIKENYSRDINMSNVAEAFSMSYSYFSKFFKDEAGLNFSDYLNQIRMEAAKKLLEDPSCKIYEAAHQVGIDNAKYFTRLFHQYYGISPKAYQQKSSKS